MRYDLDQAAMAITTALGANGTIPADLSTAINLNLATVLVSGKPIRQSVPLGAGDGPGDRIVPEVAGVIRMGFIAAVGRRRTNNLLSADARFSELIAQDIAIVGQRVRGGAGLGAC